MAILAVFAALWFEHEDPGAEDHGDYCVNNAISSGCPPFCSAIVQSDCHTC